MENRTRGRLTAVAAGVLAALAGSACAPGPPPEALFAEAEALRLRYEKTASRAAIAKYEEAMIAWQRQGDRRGAARAGQGIGATYGQLGLLHESLRHYQAALELAQGTADRGLESEARSAVGVAQVLVADRQDAFGRARDECQRALDLARRSGGGRAEARALECLGEVAYYQQRPADALAHYSAARRLWDGLGDRRGQAQTLLYLGYLYSDLNRFDEAQACYESARRVWTSLEDERERAITLVAEARLRVRRGEYQEALEGFQGALALLRPMGDAVWEGSSLTGIASVYEDMAETRLALEYLEEALRIFETAGLKNVAVDVLVSLGATYLASGDAARALSRFERALALADELGILRWKAVAERFVGAVHLSRQLPSVARPYLESSLAAQPAIEDLRLEAQTRADLGEVRLLLGEPREAARYFDRALALSRAARDRVTEARGRFGLARTSAAVGDLDAARKEVGRALSVAESLRTATESRDLRASYLASAYRFYEFQMDVLMRLHRARPREGLAAAAFEASERARARSLLDRLTEAGVDLRQGVDPELLKREQALRKAFDDWGEGLGQPGRSPASQGDADREYAELEQRYSHVQGEIRRRSPRYAALVQPQPLRLAEVQTQVLDPDTLLLEYALGEERSYLWAVSDRSYSSYELAPRAEIERAALQVYEHLTARLDVTGNLPGRRRRVELADAEYWRAAARLSERLLGPVAGKMAGKRILVVSDGALLYLPFAALPVPGGGTPPVPMAVEHEVVSLPSASALGLLRREAHRRTTPPGAVAVLADPVFEHDDPRLAATDGAGALSLRAGHREFPRLAATREEAATIVAAAPAGTTLRATGFQASRATALSPDLARYRVVHFATHAVLDDESPERSGIVLSMFDERGRTQDGFLRLHDIYGLDLPAELVVLSACDTALGRHVRGEGLVGTVRGFMYAGAKRVVASLWKVDDEATGELMGAFYRGMLEEGRAPADALRQAQLTLWRGRRWRAPFYWAAFVLQGEPN